MCLITLNWQPGSSRPLLLAANRDEFYARPTRSLHHWPRQRILAGQDLQAGGTWLGLGVCAATGRIRMAALTNYRDVANHRVDAESRGHIAVSFLSSSITAKSYLETLAKKTSMYNPFNLILFDGQHLLGFESRHARLFALPAGVTAVSNADFNTPWPKLMSLSSAFERTLLQDTGAGVNEDSLKNRLFDLLSNSNVAPDEALPQTGIALERERALSATFIRTPDYGTRACSIISIKEQTATFTERSFDASGFKGEVTETIGLDILQ